jgi:hypothetical protein
VWSQGSQPVSLAIVSHVSDNPSNSDNEVGSKKGKFKTPSWLCKEMHCTYLCPRMDEASHMLENISNTQMKHYTDYHKLSPNPPLVDELVNLLPSSVNPVDQVVNLDPSSINRVHQVIDLSMSLIDPLHQVVDLISPSFDPTPLLKSEDVA